MILALEKQLDPRLVKFGRLITSLVISAEDPMLFNSKVFKNAHCPKVVSAEGSASSTDCSFQQASNA